MGALEGWMGTGRNAWSFPSKPWHNYGQVDGSAGKK